MRLWRCRRAAIAAAPIAQCPGRIPRRAWLDARRRIIAVPAEGMAPAHARKPHPPPSPRAMRADGIGGIGGAGRQIAALPPDQRRERPLIKLDQREQAARRQAGRHGRDTFVGVGEVTGTRTCRCGAPDPAPPASIRSGSAQSQFHAGRITDFSPSRQRGVSNLLVIHPDIREFGQARLHLLME